MSCDYGYLCKSCNETVILGNHTDKLLLEIFSIEEKLNAFPEALEGTSIALYDFPGPVFYEDGFWPCVQFLKAHRGHDLYMRDEYSDRSRDKKLVKP